LGADPAAEIKQLIPAAAAISLRDMDALAKSSAAPKPADVESKSLTLMLLSLKVSDDEKAREEFRFLTEGTPQPSRLAEEIYRNVRGRGPLRFAFGPVSMIQADRITDCTCNADGDKATGVVSFTVPELYQGKVQYSARREKGKWRIVEFRMPANGIRIVRMDDGKWTSK
jgi:hypothetical protein